MTAFWEVREADALERLREMPDASVQCCVTSPPYFGLRDYSVAGQIGLEATPDEFVARLVEVFREVRRVLRDDGTLWLNIGDSYCSTAPGTKNAPMKKGSATDPEQWANERVRTPPGMKPKDLMGIPWLLAFALRADGWFLRSDIIWAKPNPMPESVTDRPTSAHEHVFLLSKSKTYFYDADAIREALTYDNGDSAGTRALDARGLSAIETGRSDGFTKPSRNAANGMGRNKRNVWEIATQPYADAHFATFPCKLVEPCILAGSSPKACGECGAPWVRVVERFVPVDPGRGDGSKLRDAVGLSDRAASAAKRQLGGNYQKQLDENPPQTVGWRPSCAHTDDTGHSIILDPFAGSGTTGLVALRHDRSFIGIELSPAYAEMARNRIRDDAPLLNTPAEVAA